MKPKGSKAADELTALVFKFVGAEKRSDVVCPREQSEMTPCVARDGGTAVADVGVCVGCGEDPKVLLADHLAKHPE